MQLKCVQGLSLVWTGWLALLYISLSVHEPNLISAQIYKSRNECLALTTLYEIKFLETVFEVYQSVEFETMSPVENCYFDLEEFVLRSVTVYENGTRLFCGIDEIDSKILALKLFHGFFRPHTNYTAVFRMRKLIKQAAEGLIFKVYRDIYAMKTNWYAMVKIGPAQCGKVYACINSLLGFQTLTIMAHHPVTHNLFCPGIIRKLKPVIPNLHTTICENTLKVGVNNMHFTIADLHQMSFRNFENETELYHQIDLVSPRDKYGLIYAEILYHFDIIKRIYSMLILCLPIERFNVYFYFLPNAQYFEPRIMSGVCLFSAQDIEHNIELEVTLYGYLRCLLYQGWMNERLMNSWTLQFALEAMFEILLNQFQVMSISNSYYRDGLEGSRTELAPLVNYHSDTSLVQLEGPWRKGAAFFQMLGAVNNAYLASLMWSFLYKQPIVQSYTAYLNWLIGPSEVLQLGQEQFLEMLGTWTEIDGYPILSADVPIKRMICINQHNVGSYFRSFIFPFQVSYNFPETLTTNIEWTDPRSMYNCQGVKKYTLYPYLVNANLYMFGRVLYDTKNWRRWASKLMKYEIRNSLTPLQRIQLVTDALFFADQGKLCYSIAMKYFVAMRVETDETSWRNFDKSLTYLEAKARYTSAYPLFKRMMADVIAKFFKDTSDKGQYHSMAIKWSCWMGSGACRRYVNELTKDTLQNPTYRPSRKEILCAGMRQIEYAIFKMLISNMSKPNWRDPNFYVDMFVCSESKPILRDLMFYLFFDNTWKFRGSRLTEVLIKMIRMSKTGSDMALFYMKHDASGVLKLLGLDNFFEVIRELSNYTRENTWFIRLVKLLRMKGYVDRDMFVQYRPIMDKMKENKRWYNRNYDIVYKFMSLDYAQLLPYLEEEDGVYLTPFSQPQAGGL